MKINLERSWGVLGSVSSYTIDTNKLPKSKAAELKDLLSQSEFYKLSSTRSNPTPKKGAADYFTYNITVEDGAKNHSLKCTDLRMTKELRELISSLSQVKD